MNIGLPVIVMLQYTVGCQKVNGLWQLVSKNEMNVVSEDVGTT